MEVRKAIELISVNYRVCWEVVSAMKKEKAGSRGEGVLEVGTACNFKYRDEGRTHLEDFKEVRKHAM